jgi:hypothetical protein
VAHKRLVPHEQLGEPPRGRAHRPAVVLLERDGAAAALPRKEPAAGWSQLGLGDAQL